MIQRARRLSCGSGLSNRQGFAYLMALLAVMVLGILLGAAGQSWSLTMQREREEELLFRGLQLRDALSRWHYPKAVGASVATPLGDLKDLLQDPRTPATVRHLRRLYRDPVTNADWELIREPGRGVVGVISRSRAATLKRDNFPPELQEFADATRYDQWRFVARPDAGR